MSSQQAGPPPVVPTAMARASWPYTDRSSKSVVTSASSFPCGPLRTLTLSPGAATIRRMEALAFWKAVTVDTTDVLGRVLGLLDESGARFCAIGGVAVNAYVEPVVTLDLDLVIVASDLSGLEAKLTAFRVERFPHSVNLSAPGSDLRVQFQTDPRYQAFVDRAERRTVLGLSLPVAAVEDVLQGKLWAVLDPERRASKRQKDLADIARLIEQYPELRERVPPEVASRLV